MYCFHDIINTKSKIHPRKVFIKSHNRKLSYSNFVIKANILASYFNNKNLKKGDRVAIMTFNCLEFVETMYATSKLGLIIVPINFRNSIKEFEEVIIQSKCNFLIFQEQFFDICKLAWEKKIIEKKNLLIISKKKIYPSIKSYRNIFASKTDTSSKVTRTKKINKEDIWSIMFTSGTTGKPKGVVRNHESYYLLSLTTSIELGIKNEDSALLVMPLCHANSFNFFCAYALNGTTINIYTNEKFSAKTFLDLIISNNVSFTSLVPTHYIMILDYIKENNLTQLDQLKVKFMISSAPARKETKKLILHHFKNSSLYELYGSSESGWVTMLHPNEQFSNLGSVGRECVGSSNVKILNAKKKEVKEGKVGELYACTPYNFSYYWNNKEKTKEAFLNDYVTVGDLAYRDKKGYIYLVDRKQNMIISGGENIYPSEIESIISLYEKIKDVAVVGQQDRKWGEIVCAFLVLKKDNDFDEISFYKWIRKKIAKYKQPKKIIIIKQEDMPINSTGKIIHSNLRKLLKN